MWKKRSRSRSFYIPFNDIDDRQVDHGAYLVIAKWLLDLFSGSEESEVDERGDTHPRDRTPSEFVDELEREEEEVYPNGATSDIRLVHRLQ